MKTKSHGHKFLVLGQSECDFPMLEITKGPLANDLLKYTDINLILF